MVLLAVAKLVVFFLPLVASVKVLVERGKDFDKIIWDGDCSTINAVYDTFDTEKFCECKERIIRYGIKTELYGALYPDGNGFVKCSYNYREFVYQGLYIRFVYQVVYTKISTFLLMSF